MSKKEESCNYILNLIKNNPIKISISKRGQDIKFKKGKISLK